MKFAALDDSAEARIAIAPARSSHNSFINRFAAGIAAGGYQVVEFSWSPLSLARASLAILHWPNEFFANHSPAAAAKAAIKLELLRLVRRTLGVKLIWIAHNAQPHDSQGAASRLTARFLDTLDGIIYLSQHSRSTIRSIYRLRPATHELVTAHGHYCDDALTLPQPLAPPAHDVRLLYFGQVRPYKNVDELVRCATRVIDRSVRLKVTGLQQDDALAARIHRLAQAAPNIELDLRSQPIPEVELEATLDAAHAVVLPYRQILNSGAALYALSRNRPVLAPRLGSLPELQANVGTQWVHLYDGPLSSDILERFAQRIREQGPTDEPDLSAYDWRRISRDTCRFIAQVLAPTAAISDRRCPQSE
jgi:glycosyltransferase involved in cell wall biosynthesis